MTLEVEVTPEMQSRINAISARSGRTPSEVISDALENGHSLDWQEQFLARVTKGIAAADRGEFATGADLDRIKNKYRTA